jgi:uncharacterized repeat protein (TIGR03847 family)
MASITYEVKPAEYMTTGAIGPPGKRIFYIQGRGIDQSITLIVEKQQIQSLAIGLEQFLGELHERHPDLSVADPEFSESEMELQEPIEPLFRVGHMGLGYDEEEDLLVLVAREIQPPDADPEEAAVVRFWCSRSQLRKMCQLGLKIAERGRPICGNCGQPIDSEGHFCPKRNGHKH